jgi:hypothetical protein
MIVVAISEIMIQRGKAVLLASPLHGFQLIIFEFVCVDISPIISRL